MSEAGSRRRAARTADGRVQHLRLKLVVFGAVCALPLFGSLALGLRAVTWVPLVAYGVVSAVAFALYWNDKRKARADAWRTPENVLHAVELAGGWPGALLAQQVFRHKTRKVSFQLVFWCIVLLHQVFWVDQLFLGGLLRRF
ncbi:DUF1294 domain-containing protein [Pseudomonas citrulli]|uniref:DUF1294 domain-containing protein n=1 Tax=Pseudomonas citrulli TaxID=3064347 RepID=A0ABT9C4L8_9PSED|nr:DUF1294 domain-containing protein [Pseudomonas sp. K18]MDO7899731.1 DUF1294 domain-containing protein [Pseudomonas sp. K18]